MSDDLPRKKLSFKQMTKFNETIDGKPNLSAYKDPSGSNLSIGYGHNLDAHGDKFRTITPALAESLFEQDYADAEKTAARFADSVYNALNLNQKAALTDMAFQMQTKLFTFKDMQSALKAGNFEKAREEMLDSKWAREDSPNRAKRIADLFYSKKDKTPFI